ncbi:PA0069 family radical SAM protein [Pleionea sp. CnH1-48]|uniref:PA0069 family radical SAM protein n=1 Tax=Pleionea sp. CnH1-48 TaxID=2954494 RepID=UPI002096EE79|nr:PA0069 family radical SAM protein [Pleionea sp. CnH1-48]MCO7225830.1 PA0069 family radical SAM protein [Pleionea sp. CnH1-48]
MTALHTPPLKGRGISDNVQHRFSHQSVEAPDDVWWYQEGDQPANTTQLIEEKAKSIISTNQSSDVPFEQSINPYRGCEHGCVYCFARPSHAYWDFSPGFDFESKIIYKSNAAELLRAKFDNPRYQCTPIALGVNTDAYQPVEQQLEITRDILKLMVEYQHPVTIITKSKLICRDIDLLSQLAENNLVSVAMSMTSLSNHLKRIMEPRAASPKARLQTIEELNKHHIPTSVIVAPVIPGINDSEMESLLRACSDAGASVARYILLRLPYEVKPIFVQWLQQHFPFRKKKVLNFLTEMRNGKLNENRFGYRMSGDGIYAKLFKQRFKVACQKAGLNQHDYNQLDTSHFSNEAQREASRQMSLL